MSSVPGQRTCITPYIAIACLYAAPANAASNAKNAWGMKIKRYNAGVVVEMIEPKKKYDSFGTTNAENSLKYSAMHVKTCPPFGQAGVCMGTRLYHCERE